MPAPVELTRNLKRDSPSLAIIGGGRAALSEPSRRAPLSRRQPGASRESCRGWGVRYMRYATAEKLEGMIQRGAPRHTLQAVSGVLARRILVR